MGQPQSPSDPRPEDPPVRCCTHCKAGCIINTTIQLNSTTTNCRQGPDYVKSLAGRAAAQGCSFYTFKLESGNIISIKSRKGSGRLGKLWKAQKHLIGTFQELRGGGLWSVKGTSVKGSVVHRQTCNEGITTKDQGFFFFFFKSISFCHNIYIYLLLLFCPIWVGCVNILIISMTKSLYSLNDIILNESTNNTVLADALL